MYEILSHGTLERIPTSKTSMLSSANTLSTKGTYPRGSNTKGTIIYTKDTTYSVFKIVGHAAIVADNETSSSKVVESTKDGVVLGKNNWDKKSHCRAGVVSSLSSSQRGKVAEKCKSWIGLPYNYDYTNTKTRK